MEPRPSMTRGQTGFYRVIFLFGIILFLVGSVLVSVSSLSVPQQAGSQGLAPASSSLNPQQDSSLRSPSLQSRLDSFLLNLPPTAPFAKRWFTIAADLVKSIGISLLFVSLYEILRFLHSARQHRKTRGLDFEEFFGLDAVSSAAEGKLLIQSTRVQQIAAPRTQVLPDPPMASDWPGLKAREYVDKFDVDGVRWLRDLFRGEALQVPDITIAASKSGQEMLSSAREPFVIALGLGFVHHMSIDVFLDWFAIEENSPWGDCLILRNELVDKTMMRLWPAEKDVVKLAPVETFLQGSASSPTSEPGAFPSRSVQEEPFEPPGKSGFLRILPFQWKLSHWLEDPKKSWDYALLYRHTLRVGEGPDRRDKVLIVAAGFTERSTEIAARYLAENWQRLHKRYVLETLASGGKGDFFVIIAGPSDMGCFEQWDEVLRVEPHKLPAGLKWRHPYIAPNGTPITTDQGVDARDEQSLSVRPKEKRVLRKSSRPKPFAGRFRSVWHRFREKSDKGRGDHLNEPS